MHPVRHKGTQSRTLNLFIILITETEYLSGIFAKLTGIGIYSGLYLYKIDKLKIGRLSINLTASEILK